ncbi:MAG TPA: GNAT family protein [Candidatus Dormibacteraeota bacterium]|jgi:RimJ/RimL family protein N-acetyltransferase
MARALAATSPLRDGEVVLLPAGRDVAALLVAASHDSEITRWTQVPENLTYLDATLITAGWTMQSTTTARFQVSIAERAPAGMVTVWINAENEAEVGYWLLAQARGRGVARRAVRLLCTWSFEVCRLDRLQLTTLPGNVASEMVAQACGFHREGTLVRDIKGTSRTLDLWVLEAAESLAEAVSAR